MPGRVGQVTPKAPKHSVTKPHTGKRKGRRAPPHVRVPYAPTRKGKEAEERAKAKKEVAGPYRSQSSNSRIRSEATPHEHRKTSPSPKKARRLRTIEQLVTKSQATQKRRARRIEAITDRATALLREKPPTTGTAPKVQTATGLKEKPSGSESRDDQLATAIDLAVTHPLEKAGYHETTGQKAYKKIAEAGIVAGTFAPEGAVALKAAQVGLRGVASEGLKVGGSRLLEKGAKAIGKEVKPIQARTVAGKTEVALRSDAKAAEDVIAAGQKGAKAVAKKAVRKARRIGLKADRAAARRALAVPTRKEFTAQAGLPLKAAKVGGAQTTAVVRGHEQAVIENPLPVAKTTLRALPGFVTVPVGIAAHVGVSAGRAGSEALHAAHVPGFRGYTGKQIAAPIKYEGVAQLDFAKEVAKVITSSDPSYVQKEVEDNLGLLLPITTGLGLKAITDRVGADRIVTQVRKLAEKVRSTERLGLRPHGDLHGTPRLFEKSGQHKVEARAAANARQRIKIETADRSRGVAKHATRAKGKQTIRELPRASRLAKKKTLDIHTGDSVPFLVRNAIDLRKPDAAYKEIQRIHDHLVEPDHPLPTNVLTTRDVTTYLLEHSERLRDPHLIAALDVARAQERYARETPGLSPDHSEAARHSSVAVTHDIPQASERFPARVKPVLRATEKVGQDAVAVLRKEAHSDRRRVNGLERKAVAIDKQTTAMRRELSVRERLNRDQLELGATPKSHDALRKRIDKLDLKATDLRERAKRQEAVAALKAEAARGLRKDPAIWKEVEGAMVADVQKVIAGKEGLTQPEYAYTGVAREVPTQGAGGQKFSRVPGKSKRKTGRAELTGSVREGLGPYIHDSIGAPVARRHIFAALRDFLGRNQVRAGGKTSFTGDEARQLFEDPASGITRSSHVLIPTQLTKRAFDFIRKDSQNLHPGDEWVRQMQGVLADHEQSLALSQGKDRLYSIVRRPAADEFFGQMTSARMSKTITRVNHATSYLILATSPAWAIMQIAAEYGQAALAEPKLLSPRYVRKLIRAYHGMAPEKRQAFESWTGVTTRNLEHASEAQLGMDVADNLAGAESTFGVLNATPGGRLIRSIPNTIRNIDQWKGGRIRVLTAAAKIDREMNGHLNGFLRGTGGLYREQMRLSQQLKGLPLSKQLDYWAEHPKAVERYQSYLDDMLGNWTALTQNERIASQLVIFYPFLRMSLRWTFHAFPKHHPLRAAASYWLGQQNANELSKLLHGDPAFFTQWGTVPLHLGPGETSLMDLSRIAPGSNAIIEALGGSAAGEGPWGAKALRIAQPGLSTLVTGALGINPLTGQQEAHSGVQAANAALSLSPVARESEKLVVPEGRKRAEGSVELFGSTERQNSLDKLFKALRDSEATQAARTLGMPAIPKNVEHERDVSKLGDILGKLSENSSSKRKSKAAELAQGTTPKTRAEAEVAAMKDAYDKANGELDKLFNKYKVPYKKEEERFFNRYGDIYYGSGDSSSSGTPGGAFHSTFGGGASSGQGTPYQQVFGG